MKHLLKLIVALVVTLVLWSGSASAGEEVVLSEDNRSILQGDWNGELQSNDSKGETRWRSEVTLNVSDQAAEEGKFYLKKNKKKWDTKIKLTSGKALMSFGFEERAFTLEKDGAVYALRAIYSSEWQGYPRKNVLVLTKN